MCLFLLLIERAALEAYFWYYHFLCSSLWPLLLLFAVVSLFLLYKHNLLAFLSKHSQPNPLPTHSHSFIPEGRAPTSSQPLTVGSITHLLPFQARIFVLSPLLPPCLGRAPCSCPQSCLVILLQIPSSLLLTLMPEKRLDNGCAAAVLRPPPMQPTFLFTPRASPSAYIHLLSPVFGYKSYRRRMA